MTPFVAETTMANEELVRLNLTVPKDLLEAFKVISRKERRSLSAQFSYWIEEKLEELEDEIDAQIIDEYERQPKTLVSSEDFWAEVEQD